jgi:hypothetical protein
LSNCRVASGVVGRWFRVLLLAVVVHVPLPAVADDDAADLPARVGRVSEIAGELFLATRDRANEWVPIGLNYPITSGDSLWVSAHGRAEIDFGGGRFRMAGDTNLQVTALDDRQLALFVASGRVIVRVRSLGSGEFARIETPNTEIDIDRPGQYRVDVDADQARTTLAVREGEAGIRFAAGIQLTLPGQAATVMGVDGAGLAIQNGFGSDGFDTWSAARDQRYDFSRAPAYVAPDVVGARDLDDYGTWESAPTYGPVWYPSTVAVGWAPYRFGYWTWVAPWGWTWVDAAPWGYAPFHYGRWVWVSGRWGWCPGAPLARATWAPALVGWYGGQAWVSAGVPVYGWVPLGWGDPYLPSWGRCSQRCYRQFNQPYAVAQTDRSRAHAPPRYANSSVPGAITAVSAPVFSGARPVAPNQVGAGGLLAAIAPPMSAAPAVMPQPGRGSQHPVAAAPTPAGAQYQKLGQPDTRVAPPGSPMQSVPRGAMDAALPTRRVGVTPTPPNGGKAVASPPARELPANLAPIQVAPSSAAAQMYGGVPDGRGAYTGVAPTPGPKAPIVVDRGIAVPPPAQLMTRRVVPVGVPSLASPAQGAQGPAHDARPSALARVAPASGPGGAAGVSSAPAAK